MQIWNSISDSLSSHPTMHPLAWLWSALTPVDFHPVASLHSSLGGSTTLCCFSC